MLEVAKCLKTREFEGCIFDKYSWVYNNNALVLLIEFM